MSGLFEKTITLGEILGLIGGLFLVGLPIAIKWWRHTHPLIVDLADFWDSRPGLLWDANWRKSLSIRPEDSEEPAVSVHARLRMREGFRLRTVHITVSNRKWFCTNKHRGHKFLHVRCWQSVPSAIAHVVEVIEDSGRRLDLIETTEPIPISGQPTMQFESSPSGYGELVELSPALSEHDEPMIVNILIEAASNWKGRLVFEARLGGGRAVVVSKTVKVGVPIHGPS